MNRERSLGVLAIALGALAAVMAAFPAHALGFGVLAITLLGVAIVFVGYQRYSRAKGVPRADSTVDDVEVRPPVPTPGDAFDVHWDDYRFKAVASAVVAIDRGCSSEEAIRLVERGGWTDDELAAAYFTGQTTRPRGARERWLARLFPGADRATMRAHAVRELAERLGHERGDTA